MKICVAMQGSRENFHIPKWGPLMTSIPPDSSKSSEGFQGGPSFLSTVNGSPHQKPAWDVQSPQSRGPISHVVGQGLPYRSPSSPGPGPRGNTQQQRGLRIGPAQNTQGVYVAQMQGHSSALGRRPINPASVSPVNGMEQHASHSLERGRRTMIPSPKSPIFPPWGEGPRKRRDGDDYLALAERLATRVYNDLLGGREGVTSGKVAQGTLSALGVPSYEAIGLMPQGIPCLRRLALLEGKVNAFFHSHVAAKKITTLYDLSFELTHDEGVEEFEDLGLGPLLCHPLVGHYFSPPVGVEVHKITAGEVVQQLSDYIGNLGKDTRVQIESFLAYITKERSLPTPQHLCIRVQSLGMHIGFIRRAKKAEKELINIWESRVKAEFDKKEKPTVMERVNSFFAAERKRNASLGKRKFAGFSSEASPGSNDDMDDEDHVGAKRMVGVLQKSSTKSKMHVEEGSLLNLPAARTCPYPSAAEEQARFKKQELRQFVANSEQEDFSLSSVELQEFVMILKDACENRSVHEVLMKMIEMSRKFKGTKKRSGKSKIFKAYPAIGLLNVAVLSVKAGYWDSMYKNLLDAAGESNAPAKDQIRSVHVAAPISVESNSGGANSCQGSKVSGVDEIVAAISEHYVQYLKHRVVEDSQSLPKTLWLFLHWVYQSEEWIAGKHSVEDFASLGFGKFSDFLEKNLDFIPSQILGPQDQDNGSKKLSAEVHMERVLVFLGQALSMMKENGSFLEEHISGLLYRQFKVRNIEELGVNSLGHLLELVKDEQHKPASSNHIFFLALLLPPCGLQGSRNVDLLRETSLQAEASENGYETKVGVLGNMTSADAGRCLLKAPFLADLCQWSQWHTVFADSLGPLLDWFESESSKFGLFAILTCEGSLLRIDETAGVESFLMATVKGFGYQMAIALLSLVALYGGITNTPSALLKSHASRGLEIFLGSCGANSTLQSLSRTPLISSKRELTESPEGQAVNLSCRYGGVELKGSAEVGVSNIEQASGSVGEGAPGVSGPLDAACRCVIECLSWLIPELRIFAAEILLPALSPLMSDMHAALLNCCFTWQQRSILHGIGLALGIPEWTTNYSTAVFGPAQQAPPSNSFDPEFMDVDRSIQMNMLAKLPNEFITKNTTASMSHNSKPDYKYGCKAVKMLTNHSTSIFEEDQCREVAGHKGSDCCYMVRQTSRDQVGEAKDVIQLEKGLLEAHANKVIEEIRQYEFGVGQDVHENERDILSRQHARMGRALHRLSSDLYSEDSHFVLELVQNADDNDYHPGVEAALVFSIQEGRIVVLNNERGFTAVNMRALCDVGNSTKAGANTGYIGHKGIGFKSVFKVTNCPEIHSNGFHVKFDISEGDLGFILPTCVPPPPSCHFINDIMILLGVEMPESVAEHWNTRIDLPIKASICEGAGMNLLISKFKDLHPSLLLFLRRLRCIAVHNELTGSVVIMHREDLGKDLVKVVHEKGTATWIVVRQQLKAAVHRPGITETEIALAFPLSEVSLGVYESHSEQQQVFAFLPLRAYGLRFIVQGDFKVPSSREEVDCDSDWNQWLRTEIANVFIGSAKSFERTFGSASNPGKAISSFMSFVPMEGEVLGFFSPLPKLILSGLRGTPCLPVEGGGWSLPCLVLRGWNVSTRELLPDAFLKDHLGYCYLDKDILISDNLAMRLGIQQYGTGTLVAVMKSVCQKKGVLLTLGLKWVEAWLLALHECFESNQQTHFHGTGTLEKRWSSFRLDLQSLPFIPLSNGLFTSLADGSVWFDGVLSEDGTGLGMVLCKFSLLPLELRTVHPDLLHSRNLNAAHDGAAQSTTSLLSVQPPVSKSVGKVINVLERLGVCRISSHELLKSHILPAMAKDDCLFKDQLLVVEYLGFAISHLRSQCMACISEGSSIMEELQKHAVLLTSCGLIRTRQKPIHFSLEMGNKTPNVTKILVGTNVSWIELSPLYLQFKTSDGHLQQWRSLFKSLGVTDFVEVVCTEKKLLDKAASVWSKCKWEAEDCQEGSWIVQDWHSPELTQLLLGTSTLLPTEKKGQQCCFEERCASVLAALDHLWDEYYHQFCEAVYVSVTADLLGPQRSTLSSFKLLLQQCSWVASTLDKQLHMPTDLFQFRDNVESILGRQAPYASTRVQSEGLVEALGLRTQVTLEDALHLLQYWSCTEEFEASVVQMGRLYSFLWEKCPSSKDVRSVMQSGVSIFVPAHWDGNNKDVQRGRFYPVERVCWSDPTHTLDLVRFDRKLRLLVPVTPLSNIYLGLHDFFVGECLVLEKPSFDAHLEVLQILAAEGPPSAVLDKVMKILCLWSSDISSGKVGPAEIVRWKKRLEEVESCILPTSLDNWVSLNKSTGLVCLCDDEQLGEELKESLGFVHFLLVGGSNRVKLMKEDGSSNKDSLEPLVQALCIPKLSEVVERQVIKYGLHDSNQIEALVGWVLPYAQRYMKHHYIDQYDHLQGTGIREVLRQLKFVVVDRLYFQYSIKDMVHATKRSRCSCIVEGNTIHVEQDFVHDYCGIYVELSRLFFCGKPNLPLGNFLHLITLMAASGASVNDVEWFIVKGQSIQPIPEGEHLWTLPMVPDRHADSPSERGGLTADHFLERHVGRHNLRNKGTRDSALVGWPPNSWKLLTKGEVNTTERIGLVEPEQALLIPLDETFQLEETGEFACRLGALRSSECQVDSTSGFVSLGGNVEGSAIWNSTPSSIGKDCSAEGLLIRNMPCRHSSSDTALEEERSARHKASFRDSLCRDIERGNPSKVTQVADDMMEDCYQATEAHALRMDGVSSLLVENIQVPGSIPNFNGRDFLVTRSANELQRELTGRSGEALVFNYLVGQHGPNNVKWLNQEAESGAAYDIVVQTNSGQEEFVEVKATRSEAKDWFEISPREWDFARTHAESFTIMRVFLGSKNQLVKLLRLQNPVKLAQDHILQLALLFPAH